MHNLHFIRTNAVSAQQACKKIYQYFNPEKQDLDFSKLDVNPDHFKELVNPYIAEEYESFASYLKELIDPDNQFRLWDLEEELRAKNFNDTATKIFNFLENSGYELDSLENIFDFTILGAFNEDDTDRHYDENAGWDLSDCSKKELDISLSKEFDKMVNCFGDISDIDSCADFDQFGLTDFSEEDLNIPKFIVILDVLS